VLNLNDTSCNINIDQQHLFLLERRLSNRMREVAMANMTDNTTASMFKTISMIFAVAAVFTGVQAIFYPIAFAKSFGIPVPASLCGSEIRPDRDSSAALQPSSTTFTTSYISLLGVRQLGNGVTLLVFAYLNKWDDIAIILAIIGLLVAGTDGLFLIRSGATQAGLFHAVPGALIATLAAATLYGTTP